jgi:uncharacterized membrane protein YozB (DUF420 family)
METAMLTGKYLIFLAMEVIVAALIVAALVAGIYQIVREKVRQARRVDAVAPATRPAPSVAARPGASSLQR